MKTTYTVKQTFFAKTTYIYKTEGVSYRVIELN